MDNSARKKDDRRKLKRQETKERKKKEKEEKMKELKTLQELKRKEIEEKLEKLKEITGNSDIAFEVNQLYNYLAVPIFSMNGHLTLTLGKF